MTLEDVAREFGFTMKYLGVLVRAGAIQRIPTAEDMIFLSRLKQLWKHTEWIKIMLRQVRSKARREKLVSELELTKPELSLRRVASEIATYYGVPENVAKGIVRKMRNRVYTAKRRRAARKPSEGGPTEQASA
ncbi:MAG: hypothetical protein AB1632_13040 [Nitrospirota bacterium]